MTANIQRSLGALTSFTHAALLGTADFPPIAYALYAPERAARGLPLYGIAGEHATLAFALVGDPPVPEIGIGALARALFHDLAPGATWTFERRLRVAGARDLAALDAAVRRDMTGRELDLRRVGRVALAGRRAVVKIETAGGAVTGIGVSVGRSAPLPPASTAPLLRVEHRRRSAARCAPRPGGSPNSGSIRRRPRSRSRSRPRSPTAAEAASRSARARRHARPGVRRRPARRVRDGAALPSGTASWRSCSVGNDRDPREVALAPGRYKLVATRGPDWEAASQRVELAGPGARATAPPFALRALAPLPGFVTADLHVHAEASDDTEVPNEERVRRFVAEGVDVLVATDHDRVADYAPTLARLGVAGRVRVVQGVEVTGSGPSAAALWTIGHHNAWPIPYLARAHRRGAPPSQNRAVGAFYASCAATSGAVVQLNHPRPTPKDVEEGDEHLAFFAHLGEGRAPTRSSRSTRPRTSRSCAAPARTARARSTSTRSRDERRLVAAISRDARDWYALLRQGFRRTGTANSDSHAPTELTAYPRNYVAVAERSDAQAFDAALLAGRSFGTTGPRVRALRVNGGSLGDLVAAEHGRVHVEYEVDGAGWVPIDEVRILVNGEVVSTARERSGALDLALERDGFVTLEAGAPLDADPVAWARAHPGLYTEVIAPGFVATAFTNPVFVDVDGNGRFDAPGL